MNTYDTNKVAQIMSDTENQKNIGAQPSFFSNPNAVEIMLTWLEHAGKLEERWEGHEKTHWYIQDKKISDELLGLFVPALLSVRGGN